jgi:uncharacterized protein YlxW (UPF0749 family)
MHKTRVYRWEHLISSKTFKISYLLNLLSEKSELEKLVQQLKSTIEQYEKDMNESKNNIFKLQNQFESSLVQKGQNESQFQG